MSSQAAWPAISIFRMSLSASMTLATVAATRASSAVSIAITSRSQSVPIGST